MARIDIHSIRDELPATSATVYLNNGSWGPLPRCCTAAAAQAASQELEAGRIAGGMQSFLDYFDELAALRRSLAVLVGAQEEEIALSRSTTEGVNLGLWGRPWAPGDEVLTTSQEHGGVLMPLAMLRQRHGVNVELVEIGNGEPEVALEAFEKAIRPGVKMVVLSHVLYTNGAVLPVKEITAMAHEVGAIVLVDGAQSVGAIPVDVHELGVDQYAFPGQKWLCGPDASGGFFVRSDQLDALSPTFTTFTTVDFRRFDATDPASFVLNPTAARFETGTFYRPSMRGFATSVRWLTDVVGFSEAIADIEALSAYCKARAGEMRGFTVLTPAGQHSGLVSFQVGDADIDRAVEYLAGLGISIRNVHENRALRISTGYYNTKQEIDLVLDKIAGFVRST
ncbi:MAG TPA: aminotransferase class V-fold PLP-dependent enzyme [Acidimicrobiales bacterium]|jgi:L-cysteine/cystine lyase